MQIPRCGQCNNCQRIERVKPTVLRCANPPFSHADDNVSLVWNQTLFDNPCEKWTGEQKLAARAGLLTVSQSIRPSPDTIQLQLTVKVTYNRHGVLPAELIARLEDITKLAFSHGGFTGETPAEVEAWEQEVDIIDPAIDCVISAANLLHIDAEDLDELVHDAASSPASEINNMGVDDQVRFLCQQLGPKQVLDKLFELQKEPE